LSGFHPAPNTGNIKLDFEKLEQKTFRREGLICCVTLSLRLQPQAADIVRRKVAGSWLNFSVFANIILEL